MIGHLQRERDLEHTHRMVDLTRHLLKASLSLDQMNRLTKS